MPEPQDLLARVRIASPCPASWSEMEGDERVRFCRLCNLNVYNLSEMTRDNGNGKTVFGPKQITSLPF